MGQEVLPIMRVSWTGGAAPQSIIPLLTWNDANGNRIDGRLHLPSIENLFGADSFSHPVSDPWEHVLTSSRQMNNLATGIQQTWSHLQITFQEVATQVAKDDQSPSETYLWLIQLYKIET